MKGKIIYSYAGNYKVKVDEEVHYAKPLGKFRNEKIKLLVGDCVELKLNNLELKDQINTITHLYERKNILSRPLVSNVDLSIIVTSLIEPKFNDYYLDKLISYFQINNIKPILIFTKYDLLTEKQKEIFKKEIIIYKNMNYDCLIFDNNLDEKSLNKFKELIKDKFIVITGQTGVGKSTFLNYLNNNLNLKINQISKKLGRGKHTTRHYEAFEFFNNSYIIDTPGFSSLDLKITKFDLSLNFLNFSKLREKCQFKNCLHFEEYNCNVKINVSEKKYKNYLKLLKELK